jgi:hypothetical protein
MWLRFALRGAVAVLDAVQGLKRNHDKNMCWQYSGSREVLEQLAAFEAALGRDDGPHVECERMLRLVKCTAAESLYWDANRLYDRGDVTGCRQILAQALNIYPGFASSPRYKRMRYKLHLNPRVWALARALVRRVRRAERPEGGGGSDPVCAELLAKT